MKSLPMKKNFKDLPKTRRGAAIVKRFDAAGGREIHDITTKFGLTFQAQTVYIDQERCAGCGGRCQHCGSHLFVDTFVTNVMPESLRNELCSSTDPLVKRLREYLDATRLAPVSSKAANNTHLDADQFTATCEDQLHEHEAALHLRFTERGAIVSECKACGLSWHDHPEHPLTGCPHCGAARLEGEGEPNKPLRSNAESAPA